jgi:hypothetical protein
VGFRLGSGFQKFHGSGYGSGWTPLWVPITRPVGKPTLNLIKIGIYTVIIPSKSSPE